MLFHLINGAFTALRAFAISGRSVALASAILLWSLPVVATEVYELVLSVPVDVQWPIGCVISFTGNQKLESPLFIAGQATAIVPEVLMIAAIWHHAFRVTTADGVRQARFNPPFTTILIRDGSVYFVASFVIIVLNVASSAITAINTGILAPIVYSLQVILLSHFYLNLHEANAHQLGIPSNASQMSDLWFTRLLGTLAGSLAYDVPGHSKVEAEDDAAVDVDLQIARILDTDSDSFLTVVASGSGHHSSGSFALSPHSEVALV
ncbi:uncharacterized protein C8Q71DRAFT_447841 [Rhodofomes roseus]|uniref:Uncharacterized protein n=1 Tax=Rhodofomes roseus TaxID=34475 RepID=A0ABQ8JXX4_9APHY|nr:uncharacterized protein C8Q71DRAFT_447841 [Rhodofomes roseus]KAH9829086.1 hypothetical protein C8Q71DRAFT_447841 [Rhodofomes roseus]